MKQVILTLVLFMSVLSMSAQIFDFENGSDIAQWEKNKSKFKERIVKNHVKMRQGFAYKYDKNGQPKEGHLAWETKYDERGNMIEYTKFKKNGKIDEHYAYSYNLNNDNTEYIEYRRSGKILKKITCEYDKDNNLTDRRFFWHRADNMTWHSMAKYDEKRNMTEMDSKTNHDTKQSIKYVYSYYPDGEKKKTIEYSPKGKIEHIWNYECNPSGSLVNTKLKDTSKVCIRYETDKDGNKIKIQEEMINDGSIVRIVKKFDKDGFWLDEAKYDKKNRIRSRTSWTYDADHKLSEEISYKSKTNEIEKKSVYHYDANGVPTEAIVYKNNSEPDYILKYKSN